MRRSARLVALAPDRPDALLRSHSRTTQEQLRGWLLDIGGQFGSGPTGPIFPEPSPWDLDGSYGDAYGGHEIAHMYGRKHPGFCADQDTGDPNYPVPGGLLGNAIFDFQGFDAGDGALSLPLSLNDWRAQWHDVMTYCHFQWMSDYTYRGILQNLCAGDQPNCPDHALFGARLPLPAALPSHDLRGLAVAISGTAEARDRRGRARSSLGATGLSR